MKNLFITLAIIAIGLSSCNKTTEGYELSGKIDNLNSSQMILQFVTFQNITDIDTTTSDEEGNYLFQGMVKEPGFYRISTNGKYWMLRLDNEKLKFSADFNDDLLTSVEIEGSEYAKEFQDAISFFIATQNELSAFGQQYQTKQMAGATPQELKAIEEQYLAAEKGMNEEVRTRIVNTGDPITGIYLMSALKSQDDLDLVKGKIDEYALLQPNSTYILEMREQIKASEDAIAQQKAAAAAQAVASEKVAVGLAAPEIVQKTPQGTDLTLSSLKGKVVLIDFWASWCKPCRAENPTVVAAYNKFKDKGFTVLSVSLDKERNAWMNAIAQDGLVWSNHVSDLQFWNNAAAKSYGVQSIPAAFLVDENGVIIAKDLRGAALEAKLAEVLG